MNQKTISKIIIVFTFLSIFPVFFIRLSGTHATLFWVYSISISLFMIFRYSLTYTYKPLSDLGYRPNVSVIIPAKNEEEVIQKTINHVLDSDYPPEKLNVVVIDDGSTDKTGERVLELMEKLKTGEGKNNRISFIKHKVNQGKRIAFASGIRASGSDIVICIDSDSFVDKDAIKLLVQPLKNNEIMAVCGHGKAYNKNQNLLTKLQHFWYQEMFLLKRMESKLGCVTCCSGILAAYRKNAVMPVIDEWLDEKFLGKKIIIGDDRQLTNLALRGLNGNHTNGNHNGNGNGNGHKIKLLKTNTNKSGKEQPVSNGLENCLLPTSVAKVTYQSNAVVYTIVPDNVRQFLKQQLRWKRAWVHGSILAGKFMWKKPFPVPLYFYGYQFLTYISPVIIFTWLVLKPLNDELIGPFAFLAGTLYIGFLHGLNVWKYDRMASEGMWYRMLFVFVSIFMILVLIPYAWSTIWKGGWVTRGDFNAGPK